MVCSPGIAAELRGGWVKSGLHRAGETFIAVHQVAATECIALATLNQENVATVLHGHGVRWLVRRCCRLELGIIHGLIALERLLQTSLNASIQLSIKLCFALTLGSRLTSPILSVPPVPLAMSIPLASCCSTPHAPLPCASSLVLRLSRSEEGACGSYMGRVLARKKRKNRKNRGRQLPALACTKLRSKAQGRGHQCASQLRW